MIIGRAEDHSTHTALGDEGVDAFRWIDLGALGLVKGGEVSIQHVAHGLVFGQPEAVVQRAGKQGLERLAVRTELDTESGGKALGFFKIICAMSNSG